MIGEENRGTGIYRKFSPPIFFEMWPRMIKGQVREAAGEDG